MNTYTYDATGVYIANQNGTVTSYLKDAHGNIAAKADSSGALIEDSDMNYDAYGNQWQGDTPDPFGYCGEYYDTESGLIYLRNRYYESETGRFITEDPAKDGLNWYSYCAGNPVVLVDPSGLYNRDAAVKYATTWYNGTNSSEYERFDTTWAYISSLGRMRGDCANFVSQCLVAGGLTMNSSWHYTRNPVVDWHTNNYVTTSERDMTSAWASADAQYKFFSSDWAGYKEGDVLQIWSTEGMEYNIKIISKRET